MAGLIADIRRGPVRCPVSRRTILKGLGAGLAWPALSFHSMSAALAKAVDGAPLARRIADYIVGMRFSDLDPATVEKAKEQLVYHVGLAFSGALTDNGRQAVSIAQSLGEGRGRTTVIGHPLKVPPLESAFANSMFMRALGLDDVLFPSATHAGLLTYPVALAVGEQYRRSGEELLTAVVAGYEVLGKLVVEQDDERAPRRPSMPFGPFASVTAAIRLMQLTPGQAANAIGYAADTAMGLKAGHEQQPTHVYGWIARNAVTAAIIARAGGETSPTILEEEYGFYAAMTGRVPGVEEVASRMGKDPEILRATQKRYPGTAMNIVPIELARELIEQHGLTAATVERVEIELPEERRTFQDSISTGPYPSQTQAESSVPFQTAILLLDGRNNLDRYEQLANPEILAVVEKISIVLAPHENKRYARVAMTTNAGRTFTREGQSYQFAPLDRVAWLCKDGERFLPREKLIRFAALVDRLEAVPDVSELMAALAPA